MNLVVKEEMVRTILNGQSNGFDVHLEYSKTKGLSVDVVSFNAHKENVSINGTYYRSGDQINVNIGGFELGVTEVVDNIFLECVEIIERVSEEV